jgi:hypothetical protein
MHRGEDFPMCDTADQPCGGQYETGHPIYWPTRFDAPAV